MVAEIAAILDRHPRDRTRLIDILWDVQRSYGHIPAEAAQTIASWLGLTPEDVLETATFYHFFHTTPSGRYRIYLSDTVIAKMHGYKQVYEALERETGTRFGGPGSADFGLFETACIGLSDHEPAMLIDDMVFTDLTPTSVTDIISRLKQGQSPAEIANPARLPRNEIGYIDALTHTTVYRKGPVFFGGDIDYRALLDRCLAQTPAEVITTITDSGLRGLGGAGFPTGIKWRSCRAADGDEKYIICNADEGEPGTFKDRVFLTRVPKQAFVGMIIAAHAVGAAHGIVYLRAEYAYLREYLEQQLADLREEGLLGNGFDIRIQSGAGSYICGDESALIESCEGKRGTARLKPPFPVEHGFLGKPTVVDNVETLAAAARIMDRGADWFAAMGTSKSKGTRLLSVSGDCAAPGIYEIEWGITLREVLEMVGAEQPRAVQISGPSGEMISASADADRRLAFEDISCGGSFMIFNAQRDLLAVVRDFMQFFVDESCGICVPCRAGGVLLREKVDLVVDGRAGQSDLDDMVRWGGIIAKTSRCGLGTTAPNPILTTLKKFPEIYADRVHERTGDLLPSFDIGAALGDYAKAMEQLAVGESR
ncbi:NAD(P)H-dependent oxidoreductase subunit E [Mycobacterium sp. OTB74]|uniref:NAD(P)H-dependent oxidoreductase subunit E n=1 Tax=Mycobacterium sp. OTB74 TaxID=1853452 RepID=UPI0024737A42|nr:NAD(P)H-dependent oxidoreductase subunit E [Mycobacterium sp. OTB74]MDH6247207.1 [NiFe] hydrogenase diaphorase moiety large subunit [Mycobacterium sp. OTB74]